jgi:ketosteroid isomerase-like protein
MSQQNKDVAAAFFVALGSGNTDALQHLMDPDIQAISMGDSMMTGTRTYQDIMGVADMFGVLLQDGIRFDIVSMTAEDNRVAVEAEGHSNLKDGTPYDNNYHFLLTMKDGKIIRMKEYFCTNLVNKVLGPAFAQMAAA